MQARVRLAMSVAAIAVAALVACEPTTPPTTTTTTTTTAPPATTTTTKPPAPVLRYRDVQQKASHNSYDRTEPLVDQLVYDRVRTLELDVWPDAAAGAWNVRHDSGGSSSCGALTTCLRQLAGFHKATVGHEPVTVWIESKSSSWGTGHGPAEFDAAITAAVGRSAIFTPADLLAACPGATTLYGAISGTCHWPAVADLHDKFLFVINGSDAPYAASAPSGRLAFVAQEGSLSTPAAKSGNNVFVNLEYGARTSATPSVVAADHAAGFITRTWVTDDASSWNTTIGWGTNQPATNEINPEVSPNLQTHDTGGGWPFKVLGSLPAKTAEAGQVLGMKAVSGDLWDAADSAAFASTTLSTTTATTWTSLVSARRSHVEQYGKGCLMARATTAAGSPYLALCRTSGDAPLRIQWRAASGAASNRTELSATQPGNYAYLKLAVEPFASSTNQTCATGSGSLDGTTWVTVARVCVTGSLPLQGVSVSSHGTDAVRFDFAALTLVQGTTTTAVKSATLGHFDNLGTVTSKSKSDNVLD